MTKNHPTITAIAIAICLVCANTAMAQSMTKTEFKTEKDKIAATYTSAKTACAPLSSNAKDICKEEAKGAEKVARAELDAKYQPSVKTHYTVRLVKAETTYAISKEKCDDLAGNAKDVCIQEAKAAQVSAKADAKVQMKSSDAHISANETSAKAQEKANTQVSAVRSDAADDKRDAQYKVNKEKCDTFAGAAKENCLAQAKLQSTK